MTRGTWSTDSDIEPLRKQQETYPWVSLPTTSLAWIGLTFNSGLHNEKPKANNLSHDAACVCVFYRFHVVLTMCSVY
jgi:hypothetical protein